MTTKYCFKCGMIPESYQIGTPCVIDDAGHEWFTTTEIVNCQDCGGMLTKSRGTKCKASSYTDKRHSFVTNLTKQ